MEEEQLAWDETVQALMDMEITQRKNEGDLEGHEKGSNFRLRFNIWKTEKEWKFHKEHEAKTESTLVPAEKLNKNKVAKGDQGARQRRQRSNK